jgi:ELWxxDGT repeat protein
MQSRERSLLWLVPIAALGLGLPRVARATPTLPVPQLVKNVDPRTTNDSGPNVLFAANDALYFGVMPSYPASLWRTDGTPAGTQKVNDLSNGQARPFAHAAGRTFFVTDQINFGPLWTTDGTVSGTVPIAGVQARGTPGVVKGGKLYFYGRRANYAAETVWVSDGTTAGTVPLTSADVTPAGIYDLGGSVIFLGGSWTLGSGVFKTNGTAAGTTLVTSVSGVTKGAVLNGAAIFGAGATGARELWRTDGTAAGTKKLADLHMVRPIGVMLGTFYFVGQTPAHGAELWRTDGTPAGTEMVIDLYPGVESAHRGWTDSMFAVSKNAIYFSAFDGSGSGSKIFRSDGTAAGTTLLIDVTPSNQSGEGWIYPLTIVGDWLFFPAEDTVNGSNERHVWMSDGTTSGTYRLPGNFERWPLVDGPTDDPLVAAWSGSFYFVADDGTNGAELWRVEAPAGPSGPGPDAGTANNDGGSAGADAGARPPKKPDASARDGADGADTPTEDDGVVAGATNGSPGSPGASAASSGCALAASDAPSSIGLALAALLLLARRRCR